MNHLVIAPLLLPLLAGVALIMLRGSATPVRRGLSITATLVTVGRRPGAAAAGRATAPCWCIAWATGRRPSASCWSPTAWPQSWC